VIVKPGMGQYSILFHLTADPAQKDRFVPMYVRDVMS
jgi:hypothetical protein